jgi:hypothetical protein
MIQRRFEDRTVQLRVLLLAALLGYLAVIVASVFALLPSFLEVPLVLVGWSFLLGLFIWSRLRRVDMRRGATPPLKEILRPWGLTVVFALFAGLVLFLAIAWDVPNHCQLTISCVKGYEWHSVDGKYFHSVSGITSEISQAAYIHEVSADLRSAAAFGVFSMCLAWVAAAVLRVRPRRDKELAVPRLG